MMIIVKAKLLINKPLINKISYFFPFTDFSIAEHCCFWIDIFSFSCFFRMVSNSFCCLRPIFWKAFSFFSDSRLISSNSKTSENTNVCYKWTIIRHWVSLNKEIKTLGKKVYFNGRSCTAESSLKFFLNLAFFKSLINKWIYNLF